MLCLFLHFDTADFLFLLEKEKKAKCERVFRILAWTQQAAQTPFFPPFLLLRLLLIQILVAAAAVSTTGDALQEADTAEGEDELQHECEGERHNILSSAKCKQRPENIFRRLQRQLFHS